MLFIQPNCVDVQLSYQLLGTRVKCIIIISKAPENQSAEKMKDQPYFKPFISQRDLNLVIPFITFKVELFISALQFLVLWGNISALSFLCFWCYRFGARTQLECLSLLVLIFAILAREIKCHGAKTCQVKLFQSTTSFVKLTP